VVILIGKTILVFILEIDIQRRVSLQEW
jgi:hypothetical protein